MKNLNVKKEMKNLVKKEMKIELIVSAEESKLTHYSIIANGFAATVERMQKDGYDIDLSDVSYQINEYEHEPEDQFEAEHHYYHLDIWVQEKYAVDFMIYLNDASFHL